MEEDAVRFSSAAIPDPRPGHSHHVRRGWKEVKAVNQRGGLMTGNAVTANGCGGRYHPEGMPSCRAGLRPLHGGTRRIHGVPDPDQLARPNKRPDPRLSQSERAPFTHAENPHVTECI